MDKTYIKFQFVNFNFWGLWGLGMIAYTTYELFPLNTVIGLTSEAFLILLLGNLLTVRYIKKNGLWTND